MNDVEQTIEELEAQLAEAKRAKAAEANTKRESCPPQWVFTVEPVERSHEEMFDPTCRFYKLSGEVANEEQARAAGWDEHSLRGGGMVYAYNTQTERIICATGGGMIYVSKSYKDKDDDSHLRTMEKLGAFIGQHPEGGNVTAIVAEHRRLKGFDS